MAKKGIRKAAFDLPYGSGSDTDMRNRHGQFLIPKHDGGPHDEPGVTYRKGWPKSQPATSSGKKKRM